MHSFGQCPHLILKNLEYPENTENTELVNARSVLLLIIILCAIIIQIKCTVISQSGLRTPHLRRQFIRTKA